MNNPTTLHHNANHQNRARLFLILATIGTCACASEEPASNDSNVVDGQDRAIKSIQLAVSDVTKEVVTFAENAPVPSEPAESATVGTASLIAPIFPEQGIGAKTKWSEGSLAAQRCAWASKLRFVALMRSADQATLDVFAKTPEKAKMKSLVWDESVPSDFSNPAAIRWNTGRSAEWHATAIKGACVLPTRAVLESYIADCKDSQVQSGGELKTFTRCQAQTKANSSSDL
jgi:hypothetical protein